MIRRATGERRGREKRDTHIAQILHHIIELFGVLKFIANFLDGFFADEIFCNFRPHSIFLGFFRFKTPSFVSIVENSEVTNFFFFTTLAATNTI